MNSRQNINAYINCYYTSNDFRLATFDASHPSIGATTNSRWFLTIEFNYFGGTATNTNSVAVSVYTSASEYSYYKWTQTHIVDFSNPFGHKESQTLPIYFENDTKLYIYASTAANPPSGKNYKIGLITLKFTRLA
jgi:hypothetical protein